MGNGYREEWREGEDVRNTSQQRLYVIKVDGVDYAQDEAEGVEHELYETRS